MEIWHELWISHLRGQKVIGSMSNIWVVIRIDISTLVNVSMTSSANKLILWWVWAILTHLILGLILIDSADSSIAKAKKKGEREHPICLVPFVIFKGFDRVPFARTLTEGLVYKSLIADIILPWRPNLCNVLNTKFQSILSNTFSDTNIVGCLECSISDKSVIRRLVSSNQVLACS